MNEDGEYTILKRKYIDRGCRIAELESKVKQLQTVTPESCSVLEEENQRLKEQIKAIRELPRYAIEATFSGGWKAVPAEGYESTTFVDTDELEALLDAVIPYIQHKPDCNTAELKRTYDGLCDCGVQKAFENTRRQFRNALRELAK